ncbi:MAG: replication-associated recombination protein A [Chloroflexi bacterium]|nr:replication-associated recombination protein A [Chloroflexota bacterium]
MPQPQRSLFDHSREERLQRGAPLAARMRPRILDEFVGQEHLVGPGRVLRRSIESDQLPSLVLWGPPGCGKTTLARIIAQTTSSFFAPVSAVTAGVADLRKIVQEARDRLGQTGQRTILFIDEIHRFNKAQQDAILPHVEEGTVIFIGATTENPSFEVIGPLLSRSRVYTLSALSYDQVAAIVDHALADKERGLGELRIELTPEAREYLVNMSGGDARAALNTLELAVSATTPDAQGLRRVELATVEDALQQRAYQYDKAGDAHYDTISAFIKSLRGSDPDAALYWLARMIEAGEDPLFIVRRMVILAAEDVGLADPQALVVATACQQAVHFVGMPEGFLPMAECAVYLATAPKSNSAYAAYTKALEDVKQHGQPPVPLHLRNAPTGLMRALGYGKEYRYAHGYDEHYVEQEYRPHELEGRTYYQPGELGYEAKIKAWLEHLREKGEG